MSFDWEDPLPRCSSCNGVITAEARSCPRCGAPIGANGPRSDFAHAPSPEVAKAAKASMDKAVRRLLADRRRMRDAGYRCGVELAAEDLLDSEWFRYWMAHDPQVLREELSHRSDEADVEEPVLDRILVLFEEHTGLEAGDPGDDGLGLPEEFMAGVVDALRDVWQMVEEASEVKER